MPKLEDNQVVHKMHHKHGQIRLPREVARSSLEWYRGISHLKQRKRNLYWLTCSICVS